MNQRTIVIQGQLPVPVGHAVDVTWFMLRTGVFSGAMTREEYKPLVCDLNTGVVYGRQFHFTADEDMRADLVPTLPRNDLQVAERIIARVLATRIFWGRLPDQGSGDWVTTLVVAVE